MAAKNRGRKLLLHEKVEVRSLEDGFLGSWHVGTIVGCEDSVRLVCYDHLLNDEGSYNLTEKVNVNNLIDGIASGEIEMPNTHRGLIRPLQQSSALGPWFLHYGQCVDLFYEDAWWEGVIIDHEDGCEQRRIFFPDMGDEMQARIDMMRLSIDWNEVTEEWKPRGNWLFLELIEEIEQEWPLPVSFKQIWYEVRMKNGFEKLREWTSSGTYIWRELVLQVLLDNSKITVKQLFSELNCSWNIAELGQSLLEFSEPAFDEVLKTTGYFHNSPAVVPVEATSLCDNEGTMPTDLNDKSHPEVEELNDQICTSTADANGQALCISTASLSVLSLNLDEGSGIGSNDYNESPATSFELPHMEHDISKWKNSPWLPAVPELISGAEFYPNAIDECSQKLRLKRKIPKVLLSEVRKHLLHLGWEIFYAEEKGKQRFHYVSPDAKSFRSLRQICLNWEANSKNDRVHEELGPGSQMLISPKDVGKFPVSSPEETLSPPLADKSQVSSELSTRKKLVIEPEYCPEAVRDYYLFGLNNRVCGVPNTEGKLKGLRAKKHLSAIGWSFYYQLKTVKRELRYCSPRGAVFYSLLSACKWCVEAGAVTKSDLSLTIEGTRNPNRIKDFDDHAFTIQSDISLLALESPGNLPSLDDKIENLPNEFSDVSMSKGLVKPIEGDIYKTRFSSKRRKRDKLYHVEDSQVPKSGRKSRVSFKIRGDMDADNSAPVTRSSKRIRDMIASSSQQTPRTVLSWLIDNNMVLPRAKVQYRCRNGLPMADGRVTREGIRCNCCGQIFTLSNFEVHAGSNNRRPSANIFLGDGRSLLECQLQLKQKQINRCSRSESREMKGSRRNRNDYICSVCHYGGELILCDQCPSAFHTQCLGLKEVPDGDWFCRSCCCHICSQTGFDKKNDQVRDSSLVICGQCEHQYHAECLRNKGISNCYTEEHRFCQDTCQQIFCGLRKILGKSFPVGSEDLTWTLVKNIKPGLHDHDTSGNECLMENYSKLNVALSVMHECFEPVKEPRTRRDLVEDVIFSRWSELPRLNFQGFYTVLLEKNDELISAATMRIYGKTLAEVPLVATRFQYRRLGMCRILMNELEKKLIELGVERLVLPAVPSVLHTWTTSFGFSVVKESERLNFLDYTFLDFQGTVLCQKILIPSAAEKQAKSWDHVTKNVNVELDGNSAVSEVLQEEQVEEPYIVEQGSNCIPRISDEENGKCSSQPAAMVDQSTPSNYLPVGVKPENKSDVGLKCYKRRKVSQCYNQKVVSIN